MTALEEHNQAKARKRTQRAKARKRGPRGPSRLHKDVIGVHSRRSGASEHVDVQSKRPTSGPRSNSRRIYPMKRQKRELRAASVLPTRGGGVFIVNA